jgi:hypothetical protein
VGGECGVFYIGFATVDAEELGGEEALGQVHAGDLQETFHAPLGEWRREDYEAGWRRQLVELLGGADVALLLTVAITPTLANWVRGYALYRFGTQVRVQEQIIFLQESGRDDLGRYFDLQHPDQSVRPYESMTEDGLRISEWTVPVEEIAAFLG